MDLKDLVYHVESLATTSLRCEDQKDLLVLASSLKSGLEVLSAHENMLVKFSSDFDLFCVFSKTDLLNEGVKKNIDKIAAKVPASHAAGQDRERVGEHPRSGESVLPGHFVPQPARDKPRATETRWIASRRFTVHPKGKPAVGSDEQVVHREAQVLL